MSFGWDSVDPFNLFPSEDIWRKFNFDDVLGLDNLSYDPNSRWPVEYHVPNQWTIEKPAYDPETKINHHDCMWTGLCRDKEHNRSHPYMVDPEVGKKIPAGKSLLISRASTSSQVKSTIKRPSSTFYPKPSSSKPQASHTITKSQRPVKSLESDGDSIRSETPQSQKSEETDSEDECPIFKHDQINIHEKLAEYTSNYNAVPLSEVTGQQVKRHQDRRKTEEDESGYYVGSITGPSNWTHTDHCYHLNQPCTKTLEHLGVQTPSESDEEIDVVSCGEKPAAATVTTRAATLPYRPNPADQRRLQQSVKVALKEQQQKPPPRPRGRPPLNPARKRPVPPVTTLIATYEEEEPTKRVKRAYVRRTQLQTAPIAIPACRANARAAAKTNARNSYNARANAKTNAKTNGRTNAKATPAATGRGKGNGKGKGKKNADGSEEENDIENDKRNMHNDMERKRRVDLRVAFDELRMMIPSIEHDDKAAKVTILREAAEYCDILTKEEKWARHKVKHMRLRQDRLRLRLIKLKAIIAEQQALEELQELEETDE